MFVYESKENELEKWQGCFLWFGVEELKNLLVAFYENIILLDLNNQSMVDCMRAHS